jgi:hypothetical protein
MDAAGSSLDCRNTLILCSIKTHKPTIWATPDNIHNSLLVNTTLGRTTVAVVGGVATQEHFSVPHSLETLA